MNGYGELYVDGLLVASVSGKNTAALGSVSEARFGLAEVYGCGPTAVYGDDFVVSASYISLE